MQRRIAQSIVTGTVLLLAAAITIAQDVASAKNGPSPAGATVNSPVAGLPPPSPTSQFILGVADVIRVNVWKNVELSQTVTVGPDGFVSLPLIGDVHVAGMTANQLGKALTARLNSYVVSPEVTVSVVEIRSRQVFVLGQVSKPGGYPLIAPINVLQLIAEAGGLTNFANRKGIVVLRPSHDEAKDGVIKISFNYNNVVHGDGKENISLQPGDTVVVP